MYEFFLIEVIKLTIEINTVEDLCNQLNISVDFLKYILYVKKDNYTTFSIPKKNGGVRTITSPKDELKYIQRQLLVFLEKNYSFLECQHGFIKGRSCVTNANKHVGKRFVLNGDIENFFDNIHFGRVRGLFRSKPFNYSDELATTIAKIVCYNKCLPQGAPTSPFISNMICFMMDKELDFIAKRNNCKYSRYADDLTFSTDAEMFPKEIAEIKDGKVYFSDRIIRTINGGYDTGFKLNDKKTKLYKRYVRQEVTGIVVNKKLNVDQCYIKNIRAILNNIKKYGVLDTYSKTFKMNINDENNAKSRLFNYLSGKINYLKMVKGEMDGLYLKYAYEFNSVFETDVFDVTEEMRMLKHAINKCYVIDCEYATGTGFSISKDKIYTSTHVILNRDNFPSFIFNKHSDKYKNQFPITNVPLTFLLHPKLKSKKLIQNISISKENYENDIISMNVSINNKNSFNLARKKARVGDTVYMVGYPGFVNFKQTSIHIIKAKVTGRNVYMDRVLINTNISPQHGMSGGPVLNTDGEIVGIIYAGFDNGSNENVGFINMV